MNKFIIGENPMRPDDTGLYVIHLLQPVAIFECIEGFEAVEDKITGQYQFRNADGILEEWTLSTHHFYTTDFLKEPEDQVKPLMDKAWYWFKAYMQWEDDNNVDEEE